MMDCGVVKRALSSWGCKNLFVDFRDSFLVALVMNMLRLFSGQAAPLIPYTMDSSALAHDNKSGCTCYGQGRNAAISSDAPQSMQDGEGVRHASHLL